MRGTIQATATATFLFAAAASASAQTKLVETFNDWTVYAHNNADERVCFAASAPKSSEPAGARRESIFAYVSAWPAEGVRSELSIKIGYPFRKGSQVTVTIGNDSFKLFTHEDRAFIGDQIEELKLLEAMKKGATMIVQGMSERGTATKDTFSLSGISKAVQALTSRCN